jgi:phospholipid transport system transporter-binding protein
MTIRKQKAPVKTRVQRRSVNRGKVARKAPAALTLAAQCTVAQADALQAQLVRRLEEPQPVIVDVSALERIDTAGLQLLAAFVRDRRTAGRAVEWRGHAAALDCAASLLGLTDMLERAGEAAQ